MKSILNTSKKSIIALVVLIGLGIMGVPTQAAELSEEAVWKKLPTNFGEVWIEKTGVVRCLIEDKELLRSEFGRHARPISQGRPQYVESIEGDVKWQKATISGTFRGGEGTQAAALKFDEIVTVTGNAVIIEYQFQTLEPLPNQRYSWAIELGLARGANPDPQGRYRCASEGAVASAEVIDAMTYRHLNPYMRLDWMEFTNIGGYQVKCQFEIKDSAMNYSAWQPPEKGLDISLYPQGFEQKGDVPQGSQAKAKIILTITK